MRTEIHPPANAPSYKRFSSPAGEHVLIVENSRVFDLSLDAARDWDHDPSESDRLSRMLGATSGLEESLNGISAPAPQSISLNVSSACNLSCSYCYADRGSFAGRQSGRMDTATAIAAVDSLFETANPTAPVTVGFLGGEPLLNRNLITATVDHAVRMAPRRHLDVRFSITTNGTLITEDDIALFRRLPFAVTISIDGDRASHDASRPTRGRGSSFDTLKMRVAPLLDRPGRAQIAARMTVQGNVGDLATKLDAVLALGFKEVGLAPLRRSTEGRPLVDYDYPNYLDQLLKLARREVTRAQQGRAIRLTNLAVALKQIHVGAASPFSCGAAGGYFSVSSKGRWFACHRAIGETEFEMGSSSGLDEEKRLGFLQKRHVHTVPECGSCWARYLCSGGCHQEARTRSTASCDFIRAWLSFCLEAYCELSSSRPELFQLQPRSHVGD